MTTLQAARWQGEPAATWQSAWGLPGLEVYDVIGSTNDRARQLAAEGAPAGTIVLAEQQTAGRGRFARAWHAPAGSSLLLSVLLRPAPLPAGRDHAVAPGTAPLRVGMAVADAVERATGVRCGIKWPNDLVVAGRGKVAGILCESTSTGDDELVIVAGIGLNVLQRPDDWPHELRTTATSIAACAAAPVFRSDVMAALVDALRPLFDAPLLPLSDAELDAFAARDVLRGHSVVIDLNETPSVVAGVDRDGTLIVEEGNGATRRVTSATLRLHNHSSDWTAFGAAP